MSSRDISRRSFLQGGLVAGVGVTLAPIGSKVFARDIRAKDMPGFAGKLDDPQLADMINYLREAWGGLPGDFTPRQLAQLKAD